MKPLDDRLVTNIKNLGAIQGDKRQASLQFNIWKYCIEQRLMDEMIFTVICCALLLNVIFNLNKSFIDFKLIMLEFYGGEIVT